MRDMNGVGLFRGDVVDVPTLHTSGTIVGRTDDETIFRVRLANGDTILLSSRYVVFAGTAR